MKFDFIATWEKTFKTNNEYLILHPKEIYQKNLKLFLNKLSKLQIKKGELKDLEIKIEYHYKKRSLDQNKFMWWLYGVLAREISGSDFIDKKLVDQLYRNDIYDYADRTEITIKKEYYNKYKTDYRFIENELPIAHNGILTHYKLIVIESSSHFNIIQMANWITMLINRLAEIGITDKHAVEIFNKILELQNDLNNRKIILFQNANERQYRLNHPFCEACISQYIGDGSGQLAHIKSRGAGGENKSNNWLYLCHSCHIKTQHQKGWEKFKKLFPHLTYKINKALKGE